MKRTVSLFVIAFAALGGFTLFANASDKVTTLHIEGMTCGSCATAVKHVLKGLDGVKDAQVSFEEKKGVVSYDSTKLTPEKIAHAVSEKLPTYKATVVK